MSRHEVLMAGVVLAAAVIAGCAADVVDPGTALYINPIHQLTGLYPGVPRSARPRRETVLRVSHDAAAASMDSPGWRLLAVGSVKPAVDAFANESVLHPSSGLPRIGHSLATASAGALGVAVRSMRCAFDVEPESIHQVTLTQWLQLRLVYLIALYEDRSLWVAPECRAFMLATLYTLTGDRNTARTWITGALKLGDRTPSTRALKDEIDRAKDIPPLPIEPDEPTLTETSATIGEVVRELEGITDSALDLQRSLMESLGQRTASSPET